MVGELIRSSTLRSDVSTVTHLGRYATDTMMALEAMVDSQTGLPANRIVSCDNETLLKAKDTTPTDIGLYLAALIAGRDMKIISPELVESQTGAILGCLKSAKKVDGLFLNWYDTSNGEASITHHSGGEVTPFISTVDNAFLAVSLMLIRGAIPQFIDEADALLGNMNIPRLYDSASNLFWGGYYPDKDIYTSHHYKVLGSEPRIAPVVGIAQFGMTKESYAELIRRKQKSRNVIMSWGGSMFEALLPRLFVPESEWSPEWKRSHEAYVRRQVYYGRKHTKGYFGISPCDDPEATYREYGVHRLGINKGYSQDTVISPHAVFLGLPINKRTMLNSLKFIEQSVPGVYKAGFGFGDSLDVESGKVSNTYLALDNSMIEIAIAEATGKGIKRYLAPQLENTIRPVLEEMT